MEHGFEEGAGRITEVALQAGEGGGGPAAKQGRELMDDYGEIQKVLDRGEGTEKVGKKGNNYIRARPNDEAYLHFSHHQLHE